jgi:hypothetical protein
MICLRIHHRTTYRYRSQVSFGQYRLMLRRRESRELRLFEFELTVAPPARISWAHDVWGNAVAAAAFQAIGDTVVTNSVALVELDAVAWPVFDIAASAIVYPFRYSDNEWADLGALTMRQYPDPDGNGGDLLLKDGAAHLVDHAHLDGRRRRRGQPPAPHAGRERAGGEPRRRHGAHGRVRHALRW